MRCVEQIDEAQAGVEELRKGGADGHAASVCWLIGASKLFFAESAADIWHLEAEEESEHGLLG